MSDDDRELLSAQNEALLERINDIDRIIHKLRHSNDALTPYVPEGRRRFDDEDDELCDESVYDLHKLLSATEELNDFKIINYEFKNRNSDGSGIWRQVDLDLCFLDRLQASLSFVEYEKSIDRPSRLTAWSVNANLAQAELSDAVETLREDIPYLIVTLREYAQHAKDRLESLQKFSNLYGDKSTLQSTPLGVALIWKDLFKMVWTLKLCKSTRQIVNVVEIAVNEDDTEFIKASSFILETLSDFQQTNKMRQKHLLQLGFMANSYL